MTRLAAFALVAVLACAALARAPGASAQDALAQDASGRALAWRSFEEALAVADTSGRPVLVDVWAPACGWCRRMKRAVYPALAPVLAERFVLTRLRYDDRRTRLRYRGRRVTPAALARRLRAAATPSVVLLAPGGRYLTHATGFVEADALRPVLLRAADAVDPR